MEPSALALFWAAVIAVAIVVYVDSRRLRSRGRNPVRDHQG